MPTLQPDRLMPRALASELTRRSLWGALPRAVQPAPDGPPMLALSFDNDYQADSDATPDLLDLVAGFDARLTIFAIGRLVEASPAPYRDAARAGHEIGNHTWSHPDNPVLSPDREFWHLESAEMAEEIGRCQDALERLVGTRPSSFRTPHFKDAFRMMAVLRDFPEITCVSTALASKCPVPTPYVPSASPRAGDLSLHFPERDPAARVGAPLMVPLTPCPGLRWSPFCSYSTIRRPRDPSRGAGLLGVEEWERRWGVMLDRARRRRFASVYFDAIDVMRDGETRAAFRRMLGHAVAEGWRLATVADVERAWRPLLFAADTPSGDPAA